jgi:membrane associated rhomboid family serine protease
MIVIISMIGMAAHIFGFLSAIVTGSLHQEQKRGARIGLVIATIFHAIGIACVMIAARMGAGV